MPITLLILDLPFEVLLLTATSIFSMFPLLIKDGLGIPYVVFMVSLFVLMVRLPFKTFTQKALLCASVLGMLAIHFAENLVVPPARYPDVSDSLILTIHVSHFCI